MIECVCNLLLIMWVSLIMYIILIDICLLNGLFVCLLYRIVFVLLVILVLWIVFYMFLLFVLLNIGVVMWIFNWCVVIFKCNFNICLMFICEGIFKGFSMILIGVLLGRNGIFFFGIIWDIIFLFLWWLVILFFLWILCFWMI